MGEGGLAAAQRAALRKRPKAKKVVAKVAAKPKKAVARTKGARGEEDDPEGDA